ncbi:MULTISPECIES: hypothetical protein [unclassified Myroides]|uniref:hypothetical protein n=1 Tax=unclassified Myroides TaxID=2642485 RepID=UPI003D2F68E8
MLEISEVRQAMQGATAINKEVIEYIYQKRWLQIWVPKRYGGLGCDFETGLSHLYEWAKIDGSLGWMLTLCSGANYFSRNMMPTTAKKLFSNERTCFGGSGMIGGTAEKQEDGSYIINGLWHYATGAPYLSHFTLNAHVFKQGKQLVNDKGEPVVRSFIVAKDQVTIIPNWKSMGMKATGTFSFQVEQVTIPADHHFVYDTFYTDDIVTKIPFRVFADLTLLVNYIGIAHHFMEEAQKHVVHTKVQGVMQDIEKSFEDTLAYANQVEGVLVSGDIVSPNLEEKIHRFGIVLVEQLTLSLTQVYVQLGIKGTQVDQPIHQIFCDFFTATQHANFRAS